MQTAPPSTPEVLLVGDIGGTNARFALLDASGRLTAIDTLACADFSGPDEALLHYLKRHGVQRAHRAAIGIANPVTGDQIQMTNHVWRFSIEAVRQRVGMDQLTFLNDFTALALSLPFLEAADRETVGTGAAVTGSPIGVLGAGTGLGVSGLFSGPGGAVAIEGEGGHVTLAGQSDEELAVIAHLTTQFAHVSAERVLCGAGISLLHKTLADLRGLTTNVQEAPAITAGALEGTDQLCIDTMNMFCALLGTQAANLALTLGARGGIYIGGGIVPRLGSFFARSPFRSRFEDKGRFSAYLAGIPTWVITAPYPALLGAAAFLRARS